MSKPSKMPEVVTPEMAVALAGRITSQILAITCGADPRKVKEFNNQPWYIVPYMQKFLAYDSFRVELRKGDIFTWMTVSCGLTHVDNKIGDLNFPNRVSGRQNVTIQLKEVDHNTGLDKLLTHYILAEHANNPAEQLCMYEDTFFFAEQYPDEQRKGCIYFMHPIWKDNVEGPSVLYLTGDHERRFMGLAPIDKEVVQRGSRVAFRTVE